MGAGFTWYCKDCGAEEEYMPGVGFASFNNEDDVEDIRKGAYGSLAKLCLEQGEGVGVLAHRAYYRCEECGGLAEGKALEITQESDGRAVWAHNPPKKCTRCKAEMGRWGASEPLLDGALELYIKSIELGGCPKCGSKNVVRGLLCWD